MPIYNYNLVSNQFAGLNAITVPGTLRDSLVLLSDGKKFYRRHRGEMVGNARVVAIEPTRVIFAVDNFGTWRQESLDLKKNPEGDKG